MPRMAKKRKRSEKVRARLRTMRRRKSIGTQVLQRGRSPLGKMGRRVTRNVRRNATAARWPRRMLLLDPRWFPRSTRLVSGTKSRSQSTPLLWMMFLPSPHQRAAGKEGGHATTSPMVTPDSGHQPLTPDCITAPLALASSVPLPLTTREEGRDRQCGTGMTRLSLPTEGEKTPGPLNDGGSEIQDLPFVSVQGHHPLGVLYPVPPTGDPGPPCPADSIPDRQDLAEYNLEPHPDATTPPGPPQGHRRAPCAGLLIAFGGMAPGLLRTGGFLDLQLGRDVAIIARHQIQRLCMVPRRGYLPRTVLDV